MSAHVDPEREQFDAFKVLDRNHPIEMLNLVRFRTAAVYPSGHALANSGLTAAEAYRNYGTETAPILTRIGASILWRGAYQATLIGPLDETWDEVFIARYPTAHAFLEMITDPIYRAAVVHRQAAVATSRLTRCGEMQTGASFG